MERASSGSNPEIPRKQFAILALAVGLGVGTFLLAAALTYTLGFPLDDSWIHVTYARNLALTGQWAFRLGHSSAGSTSPLWTLLLTPGFWLGLEAIPETKNQRPETKRVACKISWIA